MRSNIPEEFTDKINSYLEENSFFQAKEIKDKLNNKLYQKTLKEASDYLKIYDMPNDEFCYYKLHHDALLIENIADGDDKFFCPIIEEMRKESQWPPSNSYLLYCILFFNQVNRLFESFIPAYDNLINNVLKIAEVENNEFKQDDINEFIEFSEEFLEDLESYYKTFMKEILKPLDINAKLITLFNITTECNKKYDNSSLDDLRNTTSVLYNKIEDIRKLISKMRKLNKSLEYITLPEIRSQYEKTRKLINKWGKNTGRMRTGVSAM